MTMETQSCDKSFITEQAGVLLFVHFVLDQNPQESDIFFKNNRPESSTQVQVNVFKMS